MNTPNPPDADATQRVRMAVVQKEALQSLFKEVSALHARVQYLSLLLKLGVRRV